MKSGSIAIRALALPAMAEAEPARAAEPLQHQ